jgi:hypothetical protein
MLQVKMILLNSAYLRLSCASIKLMDVESNHLTFVGIDVQAALKPFYYTALNADLETIACGHGRMADVLAYLAGQTSAVIAVNGPIWAPQAVTVSSQGDLFGGQQNTIDGSHRWVDSVLSTRGYPIIFVPSAWKKAPVWMERSLELAAEMKRLGYVVSGNPAAARLFFETNTDAAYHQITGNSPYDSRSLEGRLQRQLILYEFGFPLQDPMAFLEEFTRHRLRTSNVPLNQIGVAHELRSLTAAVIAWLLDNRPETLEHLGQSGEPEIILPKEFSRK